MYIHAALSVVILFRMVTVKLPLYMCGQASRAAGCWGCQNF